MGRFVSDLIGNPEDRFSHMSHITRKFGVVHNNQGDMYGAVGQCCGLEVLFLKWSDYFIIATIQKLRIKLHWSKLIKSLFNCKDEIMKSGFCYDATHIMRLKSCAKGVQNSLELIMGNSFEKLHKNNLLFRLDVHVYLFFIEDFFYYFFFTFNQRSYEPAYVLQP